MSVVIPQDAPNVGGRDIDAAIDVTQQVAKVGTRLRGSTKHLIVADFASSAFKSRIFVDGLDVSSLLRGVSIRQSVDSMPEVVFDVAPGQAVKFRAVLPESSCVFDVSQAVVEVALIEAMRSVWGDGPIVLADVSRIAAKLLERLGAKSP